MEKNYGVQEETVQVFV